MAIKHQHQGQAGQTLIETIVAIFVLTMALTAGLGLAIYAFSTSSTTQSQIVASNLAREGVEVVRTMRDSNWLAGDAAGGATDLQPCSDLADKLCYPQAYSAPAFNMSSAGDKALLYDNSTNTWSLTAGGSNYNLYLQADGSYTSTSTGSSAYARKINIAYNTSSPYTASNPELIVKSIVGWFGKKCTAMTGQDPATTNCQITVEEHMTNWKDYK